MATQVIARIEGAFDIKLSVRDLFTAPTIRGVAQLVEDAILAHTDDADLECMLALVEGMDEAQAQHILTNGTPWIAA